MDKDEAIIEFLKGLRVALSTASAYSKDHPYFLKSISQFKEHVDAVFEFIQPLDIGVTPDGIFIDERLWAKLPLYKEISAVLHLRKVKNVQIRSGVTTEELADFLSAISLPIRDVFKLGGVAGLVDEEGCPHISIGELDYSLLLESQDGQEPKDLWIFILHKASHEQDSRKLSQFADQFGQVIKKFSLSDLAQDEELRQYILNFLNYLRSKEKEKFYLCLKDLLGVLLRDRRTPSNNEIESLKVFFKDLSKQDFTKMLSEEIIQTDTFSNMNFSVFSRIADEDTHRGLAPALNEKIKDKDFVKAGLGLKSKIRDFLAAPENSSISALYRHALLWISQDEGGSGSLFFDREHLEANYRLVLLNMFIQEPEGDKVKIIGNTLIKEYEAMSSEQRVEFLKSVFEAIDKRKAGGAQGSGAAEYLEDYACRMAEEAIFLPLEPSEAQYLSLKIKKSILGKYLYINKIFEQGVVNKAVLTLYFRFFSLDLSGFYAGIESKKDDIGFIVGLGAVVKSGVEFPVWEILKNIFFACGSSVKVEMLRLMRGLPGDDFDFLLPFLKKGDFLLKKGILALMSEDNKFAARAARELFSLNNFLGFNNLAVLESIRLARESALTQSKEYLLKLSKKPFFWNRGVRNAAREALEGLQ